MNNGKIVSWVRPALSNFENTSGLGIQVEVRVPVLCYQGNVL